MYFQRSFAVSLTFSPVTFPNVCVDEDESLFRQQFDSDLLLFTRSTNISECALYVCAKHIHINTHARTQIDIERPYLRVAVCSSSSRGCFIYVRHELM